MMKNVSINILLVLVFFLANSCINTYEEINRSEQKNKSIEKDLIMSFKTKSELDSCLKYGGKSLEYSFYNSPDRNILRSSDVDSIIEEHKKLVPDIYISKLLSPKGEIIVNDTIYRVTKNGTFFVSVKDNLDLDREISNYNYDKEILVNDDLYKVDRVFRYDTFKANNIERTNSEIRTLELTDETIGSFEKVRASRKTFFGKMFQNIGIGKTITKNITNDIRLNCEVFDYNYYFASSCGITAKVQKKMWYGGWAKRKYWDPGNLKIGYSNVLIKFPYPKSVKDPMKEVVEKLPSISMKTPEEILWNLKINSIKPPYFDKIILDICYFQDKRLTLKGDDIYNIAKNKIVTIWKSKMYKPVNPYDSKYIIEKSFSNDQLVAAMNDFNMQHFGVPVFANDGYYVLLPRSEFSNKKDTDTEITHRFFFDVKVGVGFSLDPHTFNFSNDFSFIGGVDHVDLIKGDFYVAALYNDVWTGINLDWY